MQTGVTARYRVLRRLGAGGMGEVFLAQDLELERVVALKVLAAELAHDAEKHKRFRHEGKAASVLAHPNICVIHEVGETKDGRPFLAMEYVEGKCLDELLRFGPLKPGKALEVGLGAARALEAAHAHHLVHRDIKPSNIMLDKRGHVKVTDFGLAKSLIPHSLTASSSSVHTKTGNLIGTPAYMSPEQLLGRTLDPRTDLFSLGVVLYESLTGQRPFLGGTLAEVASNVLNQQPAPLALSEPAISAKIEAVVFKCLQKDPGQRYSSATALAEDLERLHRESQSQTAQSEDEGFPVAAPRAVSKVLIPPRQRRRSRHLAIGLGVLMLLVLGGAAFFAHRHGSAIIRATQPAPPGQQSIAVLPFDNFSGEPDTDYLSDGLTEEITATLTRIGNLRVAARNSAFTFKAKKEDARNIAEALRVKTLLEGSLRKAGNKIRVTAELINAADGFHLWSETYDGTVEDLFSVQKDIAQRIAFRLQGQTNSIAGSATRVNPEAHELYLRGRAFWNKRTEPDLRRAIDFFHAAAAKDPAYGDAHLGLAVGYFVLQLNSINIQPAELRPLARAEANRALELDPLSAEAETVLAWLQDYARDYKGAEAHFRRALELAPNDATVRQWYGLYFMYNSRLQEAWPELEAASDLDPLSPIIQLCPASWCFYHGDLDEAIRRARLVLERFPGFVMAYEVMAEAQMAKGNFDEALAEIERGRSQAPDRPELMLELKAYALSRSGREAEAREILTLFLQLKAEGKRVVGQLTFIYLGLREYDHAIEMAESFEASEGLQPGAWDNPLGRELLHHPGFQALLRRAGLKTKP